MSRLGQSKSKAVAAAASLAFAALFAGCRQDMQDQPKFYPQRGSHFYQDGRSVRPQVAGTVARSQGEVSDYFHTGLIDGKEADGLPIPLTADVMARGQERYNIYCTPCHSRVGNGAGLIVERGYYPAASFHSTRLRDAPLGHFFAVMTNGLGAMPNYAAELTPQDRWAIAAYIRALQLSQNAKDTDVAANAKPAPLPEIAKQQGFSDAFLEPWFPHRHVTAAPLATAQVPVAPVQATVAPTAPSNLPVEVVAKPLAASTTSAKTGTAASTPQEAVVAPLVQAAPATAAPKKEAAPAAVHDTAAGQSVYMHNCAGCHGISRAGNPPNIPSLVGIVPKVGEERIRTVLANGIPTGKPPMPSFSSRLTPEDIDNLLAFLQASK